MIRERPPVGLADFKDATNLVGVEALDIAQDDDRLLTGRQLCDSAFEASHIHRARSGLRAALEKHFSGK